MTFYEATGDDGQKKHPQEFLGVKKYAVKVTVCSSSSFGQELTATDSLESPAPALPPRVVGTAR
jgi:hypothetical protein